MVAAKQSFWMFWIVIIEKENVSRSQLSLLIKISINLFVGYQKIDSFFSFQ
jgi:hypothetical protein